MVTREERHGRIARDQDVLAEAVAFTAWPVEKSLIVYTVCCKISHGALECL